MKITIIGGGNMGGAIAKGLSSSNFVTAKNITVINRRAEKAEQFVCYGVESVVNDYSSLNDADFVIIAVKPWDVEQIIKNNIESLKKSGQIVISVAARVPLQQLSDWLGKKEGIYLALPNTAVEVKESMTFVSALHNNLLSDELVLELFRNLGKVEMIPEDKMGAATSLCSCGIAFAMRYIRAAMEGGVEMGFYPDKAKEGVIQTLKGAITLLEAHLSHPETEIDKVTTAGGITIKGLNEMEHSGFTSSVIKGLKASL